MYNRGECSRNNDRFISQFHENLVQVTFDHFHKQKESFKKRVDEQKNQNHVIKEKKEACLVETKSLKKELDKYITLSKSRTDDYEKIKAVIENELEDLKSQVQEVVLRVELKESKNRELEVESDNENNILSAESQKIIIIDDQLEYINIKIKNTEENIRNIKIGIKNIDQALEEKRKKLNTVVTHQKKVEKKYDVSKEFIEHINKINYEFVRNVELSNREKRSLYFSKVLHEKVNVRLINIIVMNNIPQDATTLRHMMSKLDGLSNELVVVCGKAEPLIHYEESGCSSLQVKLSPMKKKSKRRRRSKSCPPTRVDINSRNAEGYKSNRTPGGGDNSSQLCESEGSNHIVESQDIEELYRNMNSNDVSCSEDWQKSDLSNYTLIMEKTAQDTFSKNNIGLRM